MSISSIRNDVKKSFQTLQFLRLLFTILASIFLVKYGFSKDEIGGFEWFLFMANIGTFFWSIGLRNAFLSHYPTYNEETKSVFIFNVALLLFAVGFIVSIIVGLLSYTFQALSIYQIIYLFAFITFGITSIVTEQIFIVKNKAKQIFDYGLVTYGGYLAFIVIATSWYGTIDAVLLSLAIWSICKFAYLVLVLRAEGKWIYDKGIQVQFLLFGLPLIIQVLMGGGMEYVDGFLVERYFDVSDFAVFRYGARELPVNSVIISALATSSIAHAVTSLDVTLADLKNRTRRIMNWLFPLSILLMLISPFLFELFYSESYRFSAQIFNIYLLIICSRILLPQVAIYANHKNNVLMIVSVFELLVNLGLSILLIADYGMKGIAAATVVAFLLQKIILVIYNKRVFGIGVSEMIDVKRYIFWSIVLYGTYFLSDIYLF